MTAQPSREAGFTLIEMLVALAVLGLAATLAAQSLAVGRRSVLYTRASAARSDEVAAAQDLLRDRLTHLFADAAFASSGAVTVDMAGRSDSLEFGSDVTVPNLALSRFRLALSPAGDLTLSSRAPEAGPAFTSPEVILRGAKSLAIDYLAQRSQAREPASTWVSSWDGQSKPPQLVRIRVLFATADRRMWPELIVRPAVTVDDACSVDQDTGGCRGRS